VLVAALAAVVAGAAADLTGAGSAKAPPLDHFTCYPITDSSTFTGQDVKLTDQFGDAGAKIVRPAFICMPAKKNNEPVQNPRAHLVCYTATPLTPFHPRPVLMRNQFTQQKMTVVALKFVCLPSSKALSGSPGEIPGRLDHFACYSVDPGGTFPVRSVKLVDQLGGGKAEVIKPVLLCAPVRKNGSPVLQPLWHLVCYSIKSEDVKLLPVRTRDQFGQLRLAFKQRELLCVPSLKRLL
jgi:hypothetical protein